MREFASFKKQGQALVLVAVAAVAIVAMVALAVDGGNAYSLRRDVQSASDAGALAGAWAMVAQPSGSDPQEPVLREVNRAAEANGVPDSNGIPGDAVNGHILAYYVDAAGARLDFPELHDAGKVSRPADARGVEVVSTVTATTFFARVVGVRQVRAAAPATARYEPDGGVLPIAVNEYWLGSQGHCPYAYCGEPYSFVRNPSEPPPFSTDDGGTTWYRNSCGNPDNEYTCQGPYDGYSENFGRAFAILGQDAKPNHGSNNPRSGVDIDFRFDGLANPGLWHELVSSGEWNDGAGVPSQGQMKADMAAVIESGGYAKSPLPHAVQEPPPSTPYQEAYAYCWKNPASEDNCFNYPATGRGQPYEVLPFLNGTSQPFQADAMYDGGDYVEGRYAPGQRIVIMVYNAYPGTLGGEDVAIVTGYFGAVVVGYGTDLLQCDGGIPGDWLSFAPCIKDKGKPNTVYAIADLSAPLVINPEKLLNDFLPKKITLIK